jgi:hypothetical protein
MDAFHLHKNVTDNYDAYLRSFFPPMDERMKAEVDKAMNSGRFIPEPLLQFNPAFRSSAKLQELVDRKVITAETKRTFGNLDLFDHQVEAISMGTQGKGFVVTSGTGSGKSLTYLATVFDHILKLDPKPKGIKAFLVYPMNALINSQEQEIKKYERRWLRSFVGATGPEANEPSEVDREIKELREKTGKVFPITYRKYTGQERDEARESIRGEQPDIILTNYMMLELIMTRQREEWMRASMQDHLRFVVLDELHTYRGRQGADIAMLMKRIHGAAKQKLVCIGTSATMATGDDPVKRKTTVAEVATSIFGTPFGTDQVVEETLNAITTIKAADLSKAQMQVALKEPIAKNGPEQEFLIHPLAAWLERTVALQEEGADRFTRRAPFTFTEITKRLADETGAAEAVCHTRLQELFQWSEQLNKNAILEEKRRSYLPLKIHQFIAQTNTVRVTLDDKQTRKVIFDDALYVNIDGEDRSLYPVLFSRFSGREFLCVELDGEKGVMKPRDPDDMPDRAPKADRKKQVKLSGKPMDMLQFPKGYLVWAEPDEDPLWSDDEEQYLPASWFKKRKSGDVLDDYYRARLPHPIHFNAKGEWSLEANPARYPFAGWYMGAKLLVDPTSGIIYYDDRASEIGKLMRLGNEGRSTATTILSYSVINGMAAQQVEKEKRRLLSFTDNRQDASLQSGHFNDFITTARLRAAIHAALAAAPGNSLSVELIAEAVAKQLHLPEDEYAVNPSPDPTWPDPDNERALKDYLLLRIIYDLKRGWRFNLPNLEQCALLDIDYERLDQYAAQDERWANLPLLAMMNATERANFLRQILTFFRTNYAITYHKIDRDRATTEDFLNEKLDREKLWSMDQDEHIEVPSYMAYEKAEEKAKRIFTRSIGFLSGVGRYVKRKHRDKGLPTMTGADYLEFIIQLCEKLHAGHFLAKEELNTKPAKVTGYRLRLDKVLWKLGDGEKVQVDEVRQYRYKEHASDPNRFFQRLYREGLPAGQGVVGREHTAQIDAAEREKREREFRSGKVNTLFCSPTMELGIDIAELNVVHMRNVPPNAANYTQRSGRAGRSGQTAVVFTYCSSQSPHDRNYFERRAQLVSGSITPARIELANEELIATHFNAFLLMHMGIKELHTSVSDILQVEKAPHYPLKEDIAAHIDDQIAKNGTKWMIAFQELLGPVHDRLKAEATWGYGESWLNEKVRNFRRNFDKGLDRWRLLYKHAISLLARSQAVINDPTYSSDSPEHRDARRDLGFAIRQRTLLLNESSREQGGESEFYVFRYLAAEGFLPGYNFTRLPVRAFVGYKHKDQGIFLSRPRTVALGEFGPRSVIYHNGGKFRVDRMLASHFTEGFHRLKVSTPTGYAFMDDQIIGANVDPITRAPLEGTAVDMKANLVELDETEARPYQRINCEEEDRMRTGFTIADYFHYEKGIASTKQAVARYNGADLINLIHGPATKLVKVNEGLRRAPTQNGFAIDPANGKWLSKTDVEKYLKEVPPRANKEVRLYTTITSDTLYVQPLSDLKLDADGVVTLGYALKRAIERTYFLEENEIGMTVMGKGDVPNVMLYEATEGTLGVLSRLVKQGTEMKQVFAAAFELLHFDPETRKDTEPTEPKASYRNLLSYFNQRDHDKIDRHAVKPALEKLMDCEVLPMEGERDYDAHFHWLLGHTDGSSDLERTFLKKLHALGLRLPNRAQVSLKQETGHYISADFSYELDGQISYVFCDGSVHDDPVQKADDEHKRTILRDAGYDVIAWHYLEPLDMLLENRKDIFQKVK